MKTIDRYIIRQFMINYLVLFAVLMLLIVMLDLILNVDEFAQLADRMEGASAARRFVTVLWAIMDFYGPQVFLYYVYAAGVLPIAAAGFTLASMIRHRELTALLAGGVSLYRIALPILILGCILSTLMLVDQELIIPALRDKLVRTHKHVKSGGVRPFSIEFVPDIGPDRDADGSPDWDMLFTAAQFDARTGTMNRLTILKRDSKGRAVEKITAAQARWDDVNAGWQLTDGWAVYHGGADAVNNPAAAAGEPVNVSFVPSALDPRTLMLHRNSRYRQLLSLTELTQLMDRESIVDTGELQRLRHMRFSLMVVNVLILAMGLPFFLLRGPANLLTQSVKAAPLCLGVWAGSFIMMQIGSGAIPPALGAWMPAVLYLPVALFMMDRIET